MRHYTEDDLVECEQLLAEAHDRLLRQHALVSQFTDPRKAKFAYSQLETLMETAVSHQEERVRIMEGLNGETPTSRLLLLLEVVK